MTQYPWTIATWHVCRPIFLGRKAMRQTCACMCAGSHTSHCHWKHLSPAGKLHGSWAQGSCAGSPERRVSSIPMNQDIAGHQWHPPGGSQKRVPPAKGVAWKLLVCMFLMTNMPHVCMHVVHVRFVIWKYALCAWLRHVLKDRVFFESPHLSHQSSATISNTILFMPIPLRHATPVASLLGQRRSFPRFSTLLRNLATSSHFSAHDTDSMLKVAQLQTELLLRFHACMSC